MPFTKLAVLLRTAESLIDAHRAAKLGDDRIAIELIEAAMFHVGRTLSEESGQQEFGERVGHDILAHTKRLSRDSHGDG